VATSIDVAKPILTPDHQTFSFGGGTKGLTVRTQVCGDVFIFHCQGRLVFGDEGAIFRERVGAMLSASPNVVVNLREVEHIDSGGIGVLIGLLISARNRGGDLKLVAPNRHVIDVLRRTNLLCVFKLYDSAEQAVAIFDRSPA
jgi:anti-sigma B factor antagonist